MVDPEIKTGTVKWVKFDDGFQQYRGIIETLEGELPFTIDLTGQSPLELVPKVGETVQFQKETGGFVDRAEDVRSVWTKFDS